MQNRTGKCKLLERPKRPDYQMIPGTSESMCKNILFRPAGQVQRSPRRQEVEAGLSEGGPALPRQHRVQYGFQLMQVEHIRGGIPLLGLGKRRRPPVGGLLLLGDLDPDELPAEVLQPVPVGESADQPRGRPGAVNRCRVGADILLQRRQVEAGKVKQLEDAAILEDALEIGGDVAGAGLKLDQVRIAVPAGKLDHAETVAHGAQPHRFSIHGNHGAQVEAVRQVTLIYGNCHAQRSSLGARTSGAGAAIRRGNSGIGAQDKTRTYTTLRSLAPEASASTNSATWANGAGRPEAGPRRGVSLRPRPVEVKHCKVTDGGDCFPGCKAENWAGRVAEGTYGYR